MAEKTTDIAARRQQDTNRDELARSENPFSFFDRFADEMERVFDDFGLGRTWLTPRLRGAGIPQPGNSFWAPQIDVHQRGNDLVVHADLPGLKKDDIRVDIGEDAITLSGERRQEQSSDERGVYRSERSYGSFYRTIPVPEGAMTDQAKASFRDGVLEITMPCPPHSTRSRRLEINDKKEEPRGEQKK